MSADPDPTQARPRPVTVVLIDDESLVCAALSQALTAAGLEVLGQADTAAAALPLVLDTRPDVVVASLQLPDLTGVRLVEQLTLLAPASRILVLTRSETNHVVDAVIAGASGYILKNAAIETIVAAVTVTAAGESVISPRVAGMLLEHIRRAALPVIATADEGAQTIRATLTKRELEIFERLASGNSNEEIARELQVSPHTVGNHVCSILAKLQLDNRIQAAAHAVRSGLSA